MKRAVRDIAASIRQRLVNVAAKEGRPVAEVVQYYAMERFLYRLGLSPYRDRFLLKGAMMLLAWRAPTIRPTMDIDLLGRGRNRTSELEDVMRVLCNLAVEPADGLTFDSATVAGETIAVESNYVGVRIRFLARLTTARVRMQVDVGFGDAVLDDDKTVELPTLLGLPAPVVRGYSRETAIAEKLNAMFTHGRLNSRMKDYFDIGLLARSFEFDGHRLGRAIRATFSQRQTPLSRSPIGLADEFASEPGKQAQWAAFLRKIRMGQPTGSLLDELRHIRSFLGPLLEVLHEGGSLDRRWPPGGPWA